MDELPVVCWLGYGLLLPAIAGISDRAGRCRADRWCLAARGPAAKGVEVVVKGPGGDVLGRELEALPPSRICLWSTRLSRLRALEPRLRADWRCFRSGLFESASAVGAGRPTAGGDILVLREVEEIHVLRRSFGSLGRRPVAEPGQLGLAERERRPAAPDDDRQDWSSGCGSHGPLQLLVGLLLAGAIRSRAPATARWSVSADGCFSHGSQVAWVRWSWVLAGGWARATAVTQSSRRGDW
jgi:hypothetical protein